MMDGHAMASRKRSQVEKAVHRRTASIRREIAAKDLLLSGNLQTRTKTCGQARCACHEDPAARHGPYHEWTRRRDGRLVSTTLDAEQAPLVVAAIENHRDVEALLARWEREVEAEILALRRRKS
jgi:hypothetical protein